MATREEQRRAWRKVDEARRIELAAINGGTVPAAGEWYAKAYAADQVEIAIQGKDGWEAGTVARVSAPDADTAGLGNAAAITEIPALRQLLATIEREFTAEAATPEDFLESAQRILESGQMIQARIQRRALELARRASSDV